MSKLVLWRWSPLLCLVACAGNDLQPEPASRRTYPQGFVSRQEFPRAAEVLAGWSDVNELRRWRQGDRMLFGMRLVNGDEREKWLLQLEVQSSKRASQTAYFGTIQVDGRRKPVVYPSDTFEVRVTILDADTLRKLGQSKVRLPATLLGKGLLDPIRYSREAKQTAQQATESEMETIGGVFVQLACVMTVIQEDSVLSKYLWEVVEKPSIFSAIANFGVDVTLVAEMDDSRLVGDIPAHIPVEGGGGAMPLRIDVNGSPALYGEVLAVDPRRPRALTGGIVGLRARHPKRKDLQLGAVLLAAKCGEDDG